MTVLDVLTLQFLPYQLRGLIAGVLGLALFLLGAYRLVRALVDPFALWDRDQPMVEVIYQKRFLARGPRMAAIGGGTGLSALLRGLKEHTSNLTAVVTVADDGGSSGVAAGRAGDPGRGRHPQLRGRACRCRAAMGRLLQYRFPGTGPAVPAADSEHGLPPARGAEALSVGLGGHAVGNLLLAALVALEDGDFEEGVREMNRVLAVRGRVLPATGTALSLHARLRDGTEVEGQSRIGAHRGRGAGVGDTGGCPRLRRCPAGDRGGGHDRHRPGQPVHQHPARPCWSPGSARRSRPRARCVVFACNVATQAGETGGYDLADHIEALDRHGAGEPAGRRPGQQPVRTPPRPRAGSASRSASGGRRTGAGRRRPAARAR